MILPFKTSEYINRQERLFAKLPESSVLIIPTNDRKFRSNDVGYPYRGNSYMLYLCGWEEEEGIFVANNTSGSWKTILFVPPRDTKKEIWEGIRIGVDGATSWPVNATDSIESVESYISEKISDSQNIFAILGVSRIIDEMLINRDDISDPKGILDSMRRIKSSREIEHMQEAARIGSEAHIHAMEITFPGIGEWQIQSAVEGNFMNCKSQWSYPSIVGGGENGTILHYNTNKSVVNDGELVLVDAGCEVHGYASDITRTWPVNGKFTDPQREIYELVLKAELAGIEACQNDSTWVSIHTATSQVLATGLIELGILDCSLEEAIGDPVKFDGPYRNFFMHGTGHFLGLDVHDVGGGRQGDDDDKGPILQPGMVLTVEPGLYFGSWRTDVEIPERYSGIAIRIEDDILITEEGPVILSSSCPKEIHEIEMIVGSGV
ncbi:MAG TPA: M24 family metallopeptidase [Candidatus Poseidoniales archaeon]|jgi:Xaa-Pro aminopeptidase|nr:MAG: Xaa-Pro aminopeptidase [Euryarchaeota archaeon]HIG34416.1 M24 family metallopeptidase [Candidatus Poseidoniales archaeon]HIL67099.1 M24 family metallopeptidase [Candidatus Poseidoniales archaeon]